MNDLSTCKHSYKKTNKLTTVKVQIKKQTNISLIHNDQIVLQQAD